MTGSSGVFSAVEDLSRSGDGEFTLGEAPLLPGRVRNSSVDPAIPWLSGEAKRALGRTGISRDGEARGPAVVGVGGMVAAGVCVKTPAGPEPWCAPPE